MISGLSLAVNISGYMAALAITGVSGFYTYRQRLTSFQLIRDYLLYVYIVIVGLILIDFARVLGGNYALLSVYPLFSFGLGFLEAILLLSAAVGGYIRPNGSSYRLLLKDVRSRPAHIFVFLLFISGTILAEGFLWLYKPYHVVVAHDFAGGTVLAVNYSTTFSAAIGGLFLFFLAYPVGLLVLGAYRVQNPQMKKAQLGLAIGFAGSSAIYLVSSLSLFNYAIDVTALTYVTLAAFFGLAARNFRRGAVLGGFVSPVVAAGISSPLKEEKTATKDGVRLDFEDGEMSLIEVDTSVRYEESIAEVVRDFQAEGRGVFVVSSRGSRLYNFVSTIPGLRLYTMSESSTYIAPSTTRSDEVNIPLFDSGVLMKVVDQTVGSSSDSTAIIFDSISDMLIYSGFQASYKFLKEVGAMTSGTKAVALFLLFSGADDEKSVTAIRSVFPSQLKVGPQGIEVVR